MVQICDAKRNDAKRNDPFASYYDIQEFYTDGAMLYFRARKM